MRHLNFFSIAAIALACSMQASAQTVTTDVMDPATEGSFMKIINDANLANTLTSTSTLTEPSWYTREQKPSTFKART